MADDVDPAASTRAALPSWVGVSMVLLAWVLASGGVSDERSDGYGGFGGGAPAAPATGPAAGADPAGAASPALLAALLHARQRDAGPSYALEPDATGQDGVLAVGHSAQHAHAFRPHCPGGSPADG